MSKRIKVYCLLLLTSALIYPRILQNKRGKMAYRNGVDMQAWEWDI